MSDNFQEYVSSRLPIGGVSAYSIHMPDNSVFTTECFSKSLYPSSTQQMLTRLVQDGGELMPSGQSSAQYCWTYEGHLVYVAKRADGFSLALLVENNSIAQIVPIRATLQGFLELTET